MSIADIILNTVSSAIKSLVATLPAEYSALPISDFHTAFIGIANNVSIAYNSIDWLCPGWLILSVFSVIITAEFILLAYKGGVMIVNIIRGSGA